MSKPLTVNINVRGFPARGAAKSDAAPQPAQKGAAPPPPRKK